MTESRSQQPHAFLVVPHGAAARCLLRTQIVTVLRDSGVRPVALVPNPEETYLRRELEGQGVLVERLQVSDVPRGVVQTTFAYLRQNVLGHGQQVATLRSRHAIARRTLAQSRPATARALEIPIGLLRRSRLMRRTLLRLEEKMRPSRAHEALFRRYRPALVVTTSPGWFLSDALVLREARRAGVHTAALIVGWDNPTSKGYLGARPDVSIAWSERMRRQLVEHHDISAERIVVGGAPQFDIYARPTDLPTREEVFAELGLDEARRLILFACRSPSTYSHNVTAARVLAEAINDGQLAAQLVVRPHPINRRADHKRPLSDYTDLEEHYEHVAVDNPMVMSERLSCDVPSADYRRLAGLIAHCDVLVNAFSTTTLEAFLLDKPVVLVSDEAHRADGSEDTSPEGRPFHLDTHMQPSLQATKVARSFDDLVENVRTYLAEPALDADARQRLAEAEAGPFDGDRAAHIGRYLATQVDSLDERYGARETFVSSPSASGTS